MFYKLKNDKRNRTDCEMNMLMYKISNVNIGYDTVHTSNSTVKEAGWSINYPSDLS